MLLCCSRFLLICCVMCWMCCVWIGWLICLLILSCVWKVVVLSCVWVIMVLVLCCRWRFGFLCFLVLLSLMVWVWGCLFVVCLLRCIRGVFGLCVVRLGDVVFILCCW